MNIEQIASSTAGTSSGGRFRAFAAELLEHEGALVERIEPVGIEALLPTELQTPLGAGELLRLGFSAELPADAQRASLESDWLERFGRLLGERGRKERLALRLGSATLSHPERLLEHAVELPNAVQRFQGVSSELTRYLFLFFRYTAVSDEKREGIVTLAVNLKNGSVIDEFAEELLGYVLGGDVPDAVPPAADQLPPDWPPAKLKSFVNRALPTRLRDQLHLFLTGMQRRLDRDLARVFEYYDGLRLESVQRLKKQKGDAAREQLRLESALREYQAKVADLKQKYDLRVTIELSQTLELIVPVERLQFVIKRRKGERRVTLDWNPLVRKLEPPPDEFAYTTSKTRIVCDDALHLVSPPGHAPCADCGKEYCRVCHPRQCPRCRLQVRTAESGP